MRIKIRRQPNSKNFINIFIIVAQGESGFQEKKKISRYLL